MGPSAYFAEIVEDMGAGPTAAPRRERRLRAAPGGIMRAAMTINDATINIYDGQRTAVG